MPKPNTASTASFVLAAALVLATWLPTVSTPQAGVTPAGASSPTQAIAA